MNYDEVFIINEREFLQASVLLWAVINWIRTEPTRDGYKRGRDVDLGGHFLITTLEYNVLAPGQGCY